MKEWGEERGERERRERKEGEEREERGRGERGKRESVRVHFPGICTQTSASYFHFPVGDRFS